MLHFATTPVEGYEVSIMTELELHRLLLKLHQIYTKEEYNLYRKEAVDNGFELIKHIDRVLDRIAEREAFCVQDLRNILCYLIDELTLYKNIDQKYTRVLANRLVSEVLDMDKRLLMNLLEDNNMQLYQLRFKEETDADNTEEVDDDNENEEG